ncbi:YibE/F family protein [Fusibacter bizertensis]|uniref:YibE/F family protein n=1 Tax=Fusibacter bizertensis TaxID=1488331 RepID=A0ABT6NA57_9FIRM|nr:YibE/F family protein [Fusibacter bizertensis]MDH8677290.1 YibE/F family protein [Fusibacter bizertensis]
MAKVIVKGKKKKKEYGGLYFLVILVSVLMIFVGNKIASKNMFELNAENQMNVERAVVTEIVDVIQDDLDTNEGINFLSKDILFKAKFSSGDSKGNTVDVLQSLNNYLKVLPKEIEVGDKILLYEADNEYYGTNWVFGEYYRTNILIVLGVIFAVLLLIFGGTKGLQTLFSLILTIMAIFFVFIPAVLSGFNIYLWSMLICVFIVVMTLVVVSGINQKTMAAIIGCMSGIILSAVLVLVMDLFLKLTGVVDEASVYLLLMNPDHPVDLKGVIFGAILIGAMGAVMDVSMSISSSLYEMKEKYAAHSFAQLFSSGMTIGKDIMGTMANTLVLAYIGSSLSTVLLLITYNPSLLDLMNREMVVIEILQAIIGSLGILMTLPLTAMVSGFLYSRGNNRNHLKRRV